MEPLMNGIVLIGTAFGVMALSVFFFTFEILKMED